LVFLLLIEVMQRISIVDSHTGGEPTRVVVAGRPDLDTGSLSDRRLRFREEFDHYRRAVVNEPRGSDVLVGALLVPPVDASCAAGVIFFNNVGYLGMCGHGLIGTVVTLGHLGRIKAGRHRIETPVGTVGVEYDGANRVEFENVPSYRYQAGVTVCSDELGCLTGDVAWGGNWFFLVSEHGLELELTNLDRLLATTRCVQATLARNGITGADGAAIDHIEFFGPPRSAKNHSRNFVLCPGGAYDRSPCGTGTSAKLACLHADGKLQPGEVWRQESILGSVFEGSYRAEGERVIPRIAGEAFITGETMLLFDPRDPFQWGIQG
jgi:4-hydroxyproline epimerase